MRFPILYKYNTSDCRQTPPTWRFCTLATSFFPQYEFVLPTASLKQLAAAGWQNFVRGLKKLLSENLSFSSSSSSSSSAGVLRPNKDELAEL
jgi:hypothetical protein